MSNSSTSLAYSESARRVVLITGASSGIGAGLALRLARRGDDLILLARRGEKLKVLAAEIRGLGRQVEVVVADVGQREHLSSCIQTAVDAIGPVDVLIANAGLGIPTPAQRFSAEDFERVINVNLVGVANCIDAVLPSMLARNQGHLVAVASLAGYRGLPGGGAYCASKAGLRSLFESLRIDLADVAIDVTTICPGFIRTPMTANQRVPMPFLMDLEPALDRIEHAMASKSSEYAFPFPLSTAVKVARWLPNRLYDRLIRWRS